jgi:Domain of unknown function (DUF4388)
MSLRGEFEDMPLLDVVQIVAACGKTGTLVVNAPCGLGAIGFDRGRVVWAFSWRTLPVDVRARALSTEGRTAFVQMRILFALSDLLPLREGMFEFVLSLSAPALIGGRDVTGEWLDEGLAIDRLLFALE